MIDIKVTPRAARERLGPWLPNEVLKVALTAAPVDGAANDALRALLARSLNIARAQVQIVRGETATKKTVRIAGVSADDLRAAVAQGD